jgi:DNA mismatch repair protein MutS2
MKLYPESAAVQLEFDKVKILLTEKCRTEYAKEKAADLRIHTKKEFIERELKQSHEYKQLLQNSIYFPNDYVLNISKDLKLLAIPGAVLAGEQLVAIGKLAVSIESIFRWFDAERKTVYNAMAEVVAGTYYEKAIRQLINDVVDDNGVVKDNASEELQAIRMSLFRRRNELRKLFDRIIGKLNKQGYLAEIEESFMNGRRVVAVYAEQKRMVKGVLHGESDSRRTAFIEPEETMGSTTRSTNWKIRTEGSLPHFTGLTKQLSVYAPLLTTYHAVVGEYDFIRSKASLPSTCRPNTRWFPIRRMCTW